MKKKQGYFIVIEGLDGSGTTTHANLLKEYLKKKGYKVKLTEEPTNNIIGGIIRGVLTREWQLGQVGLQLLFAADRAHHLERVVMPAMKKKQVIISTRYFYSSIAFGSLAISSKWLEEINKQFPLPDLTFYLKVSPEICMKRIQKTRIEKELFEKEKRLRKVQHEYDKMPKKFVNFHVIDATKSIEEVFSQIQRITDNLINI